MTNILAAAVAAVLAATPVVADSGKSKNDKSRGGGYVQVSCPPGLAKKNPPCVPPGLAKKGFLYRADDDHDHDDDDRDVRIGDIIDDRFVRIYDPSPYGLSRDYFYYRALDSIFRVDPDTRQVLAFIGFVDALLN